MQRSHLSSAAFTLIEMAIVLAIIGLIIGGIFSGGTLLQNAKLDTVIADYSKYSNAVNLFKRQYGSLPGDMLDATNYWGKDTAYCNGDSQAAGSPGTCNGDGDGAMDTADEQLRAWQHLELSKLLAGTFKGYPTAAIGGTLPASNMAGAGWSFYNNVPNLGNANWYSQSLADLLSFGAATGSYTFGPAITASYAQQIDAKIDDGLPATGRVLALKPAGIMPHCTTSAVDASATYNVAYTGTACGLMMSLTTK